VGIYFARSRIDVLDLADNIAAAGPAIIAYAVDMAQFVTAGERRTRQKDYTQ
jgi:hypothetical protein